MTPVEAAEGLLTAAKMLAQNLEAGGLSVHDARLVDHRIRETEGWLLSARRFLDPSRREGT